MLGILKKTTLGKLNNWKKSGRLGGIIANLEQLMYDAARKTASSIVPESVSKQMFASAKKLLGNLHGGDAPGGATSA